MSRTSRLPLQRTHPSIPRAVFPKIKLPKPEYYHCPCGVEVKICGTVRAFFCEPVQLVFYWAQGMLCLYRPTEWLLHLQFCTPIIFAVAPCILLLSSLISYPTDAQLNIPRRMLKFTLKLTLKCSYMFRFKTTIIRERGAPWWWSFWTETCRSILMLILM